MSAANGNTAAKVSEEEQAWIDARARLADVQSAEEDPAVAERLGVAWHFAKWEALLWEARNLAFTAGYLYRLSVQKKPAAAA